jgi:hypothetical protein
MRMIAPPALSCRTTISLAEAADAPLAINAAAQAESRRVFMTVFLLDCIHCAHSAASPLNGL